MTKKLILYSIVIDIGRDNKGKRVQKWFSGYKTKKEAQIAQAKIITEIENNNYINTEKITLAEYLLNWLDSYVDVNLSKTTAEGYRTHIEKHINPNIGHIPLQKLQAINIQKLYDEKLKDGRLDGKGGLSAKTVIAIHRTLRKALNQAYKLQMINKNVADMVELPKKKSYQAKTLNDEDIPAFINAFKDTEIYISVMLALSLGLRRGEALGLRWKDIDFKGKTITINQTILHIKSGYVFHNPKTEKSHRSILISDLVIKLLINQKKKQNENKLMLGQAYNDYDLVTCRADGTPINPATFSHMFSTVLTKNELPNIRFHDLRHTNATLMLKSNIPAKIASERLGHSTIGITLDLYSHVLKDMQEEAVNKLDSVIFGS